MWFLSGGVGSPDAFGDGAPEGEGPERKVWTLRVSWPFKIIGAPKGRHAQVSKDPKAGLLLLGSGDRLLYFNAEAAQVLEYPEEPGEIKASDRHLAERIRSVSLNNGAPNQLHMTYEFISGQRHYLCRVFDLESKGKNSGVPVRAILIERAQHGSALVSRMIEQFHLTRREAESVKLLLEGLSSKEIAQRMRISPNTVKAFLRLAGIKMGVSTRSGIIGKIFHSFVEFRALDVCKELPQAT